MCMLVFLLLASYCCCSCCCCLLSLQITNTMLLIIFLGNIFFIVEPNQLPPTTPPSSHPLLHLLSIIISFLCFCLLFFMLLYIVIILLVGCLKMITEMDTNWFHYWNIFVVYFNRSSKSLLANVLDIDDDFRCNHRCNTLPHNPTYYRTVYRQGEDGSIGPVGGSAGVGGRIHETVSHTCLSSSAEYELALILKELRVITDTVSVFLYFPPLAFCLQGKCQSAAGRKLTVVFIYISLFPSLLLGQNVLYILLLVMLYYMFHYPIQLGFHLLLPSYCFNFF